MQMLVRIYNRLDKSYGDGDGVLSDVSGTRSPVVCLHPPSICVCARVLGRTRHVRVLGLCLQQDEGAWALLTEVLGSLEGRTSLGFGDFKDAIVQVLVAHDHFTRIVLMIISPALCALQC